MVPDVVSLLHWVAGMDGKLRHINYAESDDGEHWRREGAVAIDYASNEEYAISRSSVIREGGKWLAWFSCYGETYQISYAESLPEKSLARRDDLAEIDVSPSGWRSEMIEYSFALDHKGRRFMLYNGSDY